MHLQKPHSRHKGHAEVVLTAISLPSYGTDSGTSLVELIEKAAEVPGIERIRLVSWGRMSTTRSSSPFSTFCTSVRIA